MKWLTVSMLALVLSWTAAARADEVQLKNGDRLTGKVERLEKGKLTIKTEHAGAVDVDMIAVKTFATESVVELHLGDGRVVHYKVSADGDGKVTIEPAPGSPQVVAVDSIVAINPYPPPPFVPEWKGNVIGSYTRTRGNSDTTTANLSVDVSRRGKNDRESVKGNYLFSREKDSATNTKNTSADQWFVSGQYDYFFTRKLFGFAYVRYDKDRIADLERRITAMVGPGYQWVESDRLNFSTEAGVGWLYERRRDGGSSTSDPALRFNYHFDAKLLKNLQFLHNFTWTPNATDFADYIINTDAELRLSVTKAIFTNFKVTLNHDSTPAPDARKTDIIYLIGLGINLF